MCAGGCQVSNRNGLPPGSKPWSRLKGVRPVSLPSGNPIQVVIEKQLSRLGLAYQERPRMNLIGTLISMVRAGRGSAIVPSFALEECLRLRQGVAKLREPVVHLDFYLAYRRGTQRKPAAKRS